MLNRGEKSIREIVRMIGQSKEYHSRFVAPVGPRNAAVFMYRHFLAREPESHSVIDLHAGAITSSWQTAVNGFVDSVEYRERFGDDTVPHP